MADAARAPAHADPAPPVRDPWTAVVAQVRRRRGVRAALVVLLVLHGLAIYAPLLANDRPWYLRAIDRGAYEEARRSLVGVLASAGGLASRAGATSAELAWALEQERSALDLRVGVMERYLDPADRPPLRALVDDATVVFARVADGSAGPDEIESLRERAARLRERYAPRGEGGAGVELVPAASWPLLESVASSEVFFLVLFPLAALALVRAVRARGPPRGSRRRTAAIVLGVPLACAAVWGARVGGERTFDVAPYKLGLHEGTIQPRRVVFAPLPFGFAETHLDEPLREPTWRSASEIDEQGDYVRGPRAPTTDPITGLVVRGKPVDVRPGEPERNSPWRHVLGTDPLGRDLLTRLLWGGRISLSVGLVATVLLVGIGTLVGLAAGWWGGWVDLALSRLIEVVQSIPTFFLILTCVALIPERALHPVYSIVAFIALVRWTGVARLVRGELLRIRELDYVLAARAAGLPPLRIVLRHALPNALGPVIVAAAFSVAAGILIESSVSFLGFGIRAPIPSWGALINESRSPEHWWIQVFPGLLIFVTVFCYNLVGEGVRDALDPRSLAQPVSRR